MPYTVFNLSFTTRYLFPGHIWKENLWLLVCLLFRILGMDTNPKIQIPVCGQISNLHSYVYVEYGAVFVFLWTKFGLFNGNTDWMSEIWKMNRLEQQKCCFLSHFISIFLACGLIIGYIFKDIVLCSNSWAFLCWYWTTFAEHCTQIISDYMHDNDIWAVIGTKFCYVCTSRNFLSYTQAIRWIIVSLSVSLNAPDRPKASLGYRKMPRGYFPYFKTLNFGNTFVLRRSFLV